METKKFLCILSYFVISINIATAQTLVGPEEPKMPSFQRAVINPNQPQSSVPSAKPQLGRTNKVPHANDIIRQQQRTNAESMGRPYYPPGSTPEQNRRINEEFAKRQIQAQQSLPSTDNGFRQGSLQESVRRELLDLVNESYRNSEAIKKSNHAVSPNYYKDLPNYLKAKDNIKDQLSGKKPISIKDAYFYAEAAYGGLKVDYKEFNNLIEENKNYILQWLIQGGYDINDPEALHYGIQSFMSDTLWLQVEDPDQVLGGNYKIKHIPFSYDYIDFNDPTKRGNYFITKTLATGTGQCHTLPVTYLLMAEALGVEANLSYNPDHSFVKYKNNDGVTLNFETTIGRFMPDEVYMDMIPTMANAFQNNAFIGELNKKQLLSTILIDLSVSFLLEHWFADEAIVVDCITTAEGYFPNREYINTSSLWIKKKCLSQRFNKLVQEKGIKDLNEIERYPEVKAAFDDLKNFLERTKKIGIEAFPEGEYMKIMAFHDKEGRLQKEQNIDTKSKRSLYQKE